MMKLLTWISNLYATLFLPVRVVSTHEQFYNGALLNTYHVKQGKRSFEVFYSTETGMMEYFLSDGTELDYHSKIPTAIRAKREADSAKAEKERRRKLAEYTF